VGISSPGIGSNLDVNSIVASLLAVDSRPLGVLAQKEGKYQAKLAGLGTLNGAVSTFRGSLASLSNQNTFQSITSTSADTSIVVGAATNKSVPGLYNINVTQLAQSQNISTAGQVSTTAAIGLGGSTTLSFQFGAVSGGNFGFAGSNLSASVASSGIADGSLSINGTAISTDSSTKSAKLLAAAINAKTSTTGVSASVATTATSATLFGSGGATSFGDVDSVSGGTYALSVEGIQIDAQLTGVAAGAGVTAASIDGILGGVNATTDALTAANITFTGTAALGTLQFFQADGSNIAVTEANTGSVNGGIGKSSITANSGSNVTATSSVTIGSANATPITVAGNSPLTAGLTAGTGGAYIGASYAQDANSSSGTVVIDGTNNSLQGIRDAVNKANIGITATIVSDGSASPNHLVFSSTKTGDSSSFKIGVSGSPADTAIANLLTYDPAGTQNLSQSTAAQSTKLVVNGISVSSATNNIAEAIQGVTLTVGKVGATYISVARDSTALKTGIGAFVKAYNDFNTSVKNLTSFNADTKSGGVLLGDSTTRTIQAQIRKQLSTPIAGLTGSLTNLSQIGISFEKDGSISLDAGKLQKAITNSFDDIGGLFTSLGKTNDSLIGFTGSTNATKSGTYALNVTALASQGTITSTPDLTLASTTIAADTTISVTLNGTIPATASATATIALTAGTYTAAELATSIQSAINSNSAFASAGSSVSASIDNNGHLEIKSNRYGSASKVEISGLTGTPATDFLGAVSGVDGVDVAGTIDGTEITGSGQFLTGKKGTASDGLKIEISGGAIGSRGNITFSQGYAYQLTSLANSFFGRDGIITSATDGLSTSIKDVGKSRDSFNAKLADIEKRYRAQFTALDVTLGRLSSTSSFLTQQLAALSSQKNN
jgi:flagellar hook-associated protein 2